MNGIKLRGTGRCVPANTVTNDDLSRLVDTNDEWITARTGIRSRYRCDCRGSFALFGFSCCHFSHPFIQLIYV